MCDCALRIQRFTLLSALWMVPPSFQPHTPPLYSGHHLSERKKQKQTLSKWWFALLNLKSLKESKFDTHPSSRIFPTESEIRVMIHFCYFIWLLFKCVCSCHPIHSDHAPLPTFGPSCRIRSMGPPGAATFTRRASKSLPTSKFPVWLSRDKARKKTHLFKETVIFTILV